MNGTVRSQSDLEVALAAAAAGAAVVRQRYGAPGARQAKLGIDFVTETDIAAEQAIQAVVQAHRPDDSFLGEEIGLVVGADLSRTWLVDPLCGTLNFAAHTPLVAVNVALRGVPGAPALTAVVADPFADELLWIDGSSSGVRHAGRDAALRTTAESTLVDVDLSTDPAWIAGLLGAPGFRDRFGARSSSTSLALAWVATGRRAAYVQRFVIGPVHDNVHFAAGVAVARAAGCVVTTLSGASLDAGEDGLLVAADRDTHEALVEMLRF